MLLLELMARGRQRPRPRMKAEGPRLDVFPAL